MARLADMVWDKGIKWALPPWWTPDPPDPKLWNSLTIPLLRNQREAALKGHHQSLLKRAHDEAQWYRETLQKRLEHAQILETSNVAEYFFAGTDQELWLPERDFPNLAPPFRQFWVEWARPSKLVSSQFGEADVQLLPEKVGILFDARDVYETNQEWVDWLKASPEHIREGLKDLRSRFERNYQIYGERMNRVIAEHQGATWSELNAFLTPPEQETWRQYRALRGAERAIAEGRELELANVPPGMAALDGREGRWFLNAEVYFFQSKQIFGPMAHWELSIDAQGKFLEFTRFELLVSTYGKDPHPDYGTSLFSYLHPALLAISFLHCQNVQMVERVPDAGLQERRRKDFKKPIFRHYTLEVEALKKMLSGVRQKGQGVPLQKALHIRRGHFKKFGAAHGTKPLFGQHEGVWWWADRLQGEEAKGTVLKDYVVPVPAPATPGGSSEKVEA